jgi:N-acetyl-gamma-glutamyl-phosphate/LysW-gamma-L-alpha-aminoadipyl-6-phosphate reductase
VRVGVLGATGFLGGELVRLLAEHPEVEITAMGSRSNAGKRLSQVRPNLVGAADGPLEDLDAAALADRCDLVFLALPHGTSALAGSALRAHGVPVIDLGSDFRLKAPADHVRYYGRTPGAPELLDEAVYSLPELTGAPVGDLIANPGCFATALALTLAPVADADRVLVSGITGSSGSGIAPSAGVHHSLRRTDFKAYKPLRHQHLGEVRQLLASRGAVPSIAFVPHSAPVARGIHVTAFVEGVSGVIDRYRQAYANSALVSVTDGPLRMGAVVGTCRAEIGVVEGDDGVVVFCAIDNLLKGGSGQAVQNLNLRQGWPETLGLPLIGGWP